MCFGRQTGVIGCCICLHKYCFNAPLELGDDLRNKNGFIEVVPGLELRSPRINEHGAPVDQFSTEFHCVNCGQNNRVKGKAEPSQRAEL